MGKGPEFHSFNNDPNPSHVEVKRIHGKNRRARVYAVMPLDEESPNPTVVGKYIVAEAQDVRASQDIPDEKKKMRFIVYLETWHLRDNLTNDPRQPKSVFETVRTPLKHGLITDALDAVEQGKTEYKKEQENIEDLDRVEAIAARWEQNEIVQLTWESKIQHLAGAYLDESAEQDEATAYDKAEGEALQLLSDLTGDILTDQDRMGEVYMQMEIDDPSELGWRIKNYGRQYPDIDLSDLLHRLDLPEGELAKEKEVETFDEQVDRVAEMLYGDPDYFSEVHLETNRAKVSRHMRQIQKEWETIIAEKTEEFILKEGLEPENVSDKKRAEKREQAQTYAELIVQDISGQEVRSLPELTEAFYIATVENPFQVIDQLHNVMLRDGSLNMSIIIDNTYEYIVEQGKEFDDPEVGEEEPDLDEAILEFGKDPSPLQGDKSTPAPTSSIVFDYDGDTDPFMDPHDLDRDDDDYDGYGDR